jgi:hypothetical protein
MTRFTYAQEIARPAEIQGWDSASLNEFDRRWLRGDTISAMSRAFNVSPHWICCICRRRNLPSRYTKHQRILETT